MYPVWLRESTLTVLGDRAQSVRKSLEKGLEGRLSPLGYARKRGRFWKRLPGCWILIQVEERCPTEEPRSRVEFTLDLALASDIVLRFEDPDREPAEVPNIDQAVWRQRIGHFLERGDVWWYATQTTEARQLGDEIGIALAPHVGRIETWCDPHSLLDLLRSPESSGLTELQRLIYTAAVANAASRPDVLTWAMTELRELAAREPAFANAAAYYASKLGY